jgi:hypothetical protein
MKLLALLVLILPFTVFGLEVDEKLTVRLIKTSESRKTVMVNRGTEDGLVEGDHAKFVVTAGVVARGVIVKISPTRSIWSIYRLVNADFIVNDSVMTIKITPAVKLTKDESQALIQEDTPSRVTPSTELGIPLAEGAQDLTPGTESVEDLKALTESEVLTLVERNREILGVVNISGLKSKSSTDSGSDSFNNSYAYHHIGIGGEFYPQREREWYSKFSLIGSVNIMRQDAQAYNGSSSTNDVTELMLGTNWHPTKLPSMVMEFIPFINLGVTMGTVKSSFTPGAENAGGPSYSSSGTTNGFVLGFGYKYYLAKGFGIRASLDYYTRNESYKADDLLNKHTRSIAGPRVMIGLSYRFGK